MTALILLRSHTHAGRSFQAGQRLVVDAATADWLTAHGIARPDRLPVSEPQPAGDGPSVEPKPTPRTEPKP